MARAGHDDNARAGDPLTEEPRVLGRREPILPATDREGRGANGRDPGHHVEDVARSLGYPPAEMFEERPVRGDIQVWPGGRSSILRAMRDRISWAAPA